LKKYQTLDQVEATKDQAVRFLRDVVGNDDRADEVEDEDPGDYADRKGIVIANPSKRRTTNMANGNDMTKADLQDCVDQATQILTDAYVPEASREDLAEAIGEALAALEGDTGDEEDDDDDSDDDGQD
jgi:hypothetical protein